MQASGVQEPAMAREAPISPARWAPTPQDHLRALLLLIAIDMMPASTQINQKLVDRVCQGAKYEKQLL